MEQKESLNEAGLNYFSLTKFASISFLSSSNNSIDFKINKYSQL